MSSASSLFNLFSIHKEKWDYSDPAKAPHLICRNSHGGAMDYVLTRAETTIGPGKKYHIVITDEEDFVSIKKSSSSHKMQSVIIRKRDCSYIEDKITKEGDSHCIHVNNLPIKAGVPTLLQNGDCITFGTSVFMTFYENQGKIPIHTPVEIKFDSVNQLPVMEDTSMERGLNTPLSHVEFVDSENMTMRELQADYEKLRCVYELSKISTDKGFTLHYEKAIDLVFNLIPDIEFGAIVLRDKHQGTTKINHFKSKSKESTLKDPSDLMYSSFFTQVMESNNAQTHTWRDTGCVIGAPLTGRNQVFGLLCFYNLHQQISVSEEVLSLISSIGTQIALAIDNAMLLMEQSKTDREVEHLCRFLPPETVKSKGDSHQLFEQPASKAMASILFVEIRGFSSYREKSAPDALVRMLNQYYQRLEQCIFKHNGVLDKFAGDTVMAIFGTLEQSPNHELRALQAAIEINQAVFGTKGLNQFLSEHGQQPIEVGLGLHTGEVLAGFFGSPLRKEYSAHGDAVDTAYKVCEFARSGEVLATEAVLSTAYPNYKNLPEKKIFKEKKKHFSIFDITDIVLQTEHPTVSQPLHKKVLSKSKGEIIRESPQNYPYLVYQYSYGVNELHLMRNEKTTIGRDATNDIVIRGNGNGVSRYHAEIERIVRDGNVIGVTCTDKNSSLGVYINSERILPNVSRRLHNGDRIGFGNAIVMEYYTNRSCIPDRFLQNSFEDFERTVEFTNPAAETNITIKAEVDSEDSGFKPVNLINDFAILRQDYAKLRLVYELSPKIQHAETLSKHLKRALDYIFKILPNVDTGVIVLLDVRTGPNAKLVKYRNAENRKKDVKLSSTIFKRVYDTKKKIVSTDAVHDLELREIESVRNDQTRTVICIPLCSHQKVYGITYLSSHHIGSSISRKDLSLLDAISNQVSIAIENSQMMSENRMSTKMTGFLSRYLSPTSVQKISDPSAFMDKIGSVKKATIIFVNIADFSSFREKNTPIEIENTLNAYFELAVNIVFKNDGVVDKYIGNQIMAVFGALETTANPECRAANAALQIKEAIEIMNQERDTFKKDHINIKIGLSTGDVVTAFIGRRLEFTVLGDAVGEAAGCLNTASLNQILMAESTYLVCADKLNAVSSGSKILKKKTMKVFELKSVNFLEKAEHQAQLDKHDLPQLPNLS